MRKAQPREPLSNMQWAREDWTVHHIPNGTTMGTVSMSLACLVHQELIASTVQELLVTDLLSRAPLNLAGL